MNPTFWRDRRVFLTGHTGFKGSWLAAWLAVRGARVTGYALAPDVTPSLYVTAELDRLVERSVIADVRDPESLARALSDAAPEVVFHLAAQPLVRRGYREPVETFATNVLGTANLLDAVRQTPGARAVVVVTTDKCYRDQSWPWPYRESDELGGHDPYAASKACAELVASSYRDSFLAANGVGVATARAGNVIGGGDRCAERLVPDVIAACERGGVVELRRPAAIRPWQHVLDPLHGYLVLAERLCSDPRRFATAFNFGPSPADSLTVAEVAKTIVEAWGAGEIRMADDSASLHETATLTVDSSRAMAELGWRPGLTAREAIHWTVNWYRSATHGDARSLMTSQIDAYEERLNAAMQVL